MKNLFYIILSETILNLKERKKKKTSFYITK